MSHELENMFSVEKTPWHGLGKIVHNAPTAEEAIKLAGLDWRVEKIPLYAHQVTGGGIQHVQTEYFGITRTTDMKVYGAVKSGYEPVQNEDAFKFFNPFVESGNASFETAGSLREGKNVWILAKLNKAPIEVTKGDFVEKFLLLSNGHDGMTSVKVGFTPIRVVCANTLAMAEMNGGSQLMRIYHSKNVQETLKMVQEITNEANARFEATAEQYKALAKKSVNQKDLEKFVIEVFYPRVNLKDMSVRQEVRIENMTREIQQLFEAGKGAEMHRGTAWGLYNSVTEYLSYSRGKDKDIRLHSLWFGDGKTINNRAFEVAKAV